jgi:hypothetical protein
MVELWVFFVGVMAGVAGVTLAFGLLFAWLIIRGERNERRRERETQKQLMDQRRELEQEYGQAIDELKRDMEFMKRENESQLALMKGENAKLKIQVNSLTELLIQMGHRVGISIEADGDINVGEFVGADKNTVQQTTVTAKS